MTQSHPKPKPTPDPKPRKKFIRREWARFTAYLDSLPQKWFLYAGYGIVVLGFCYTFYQIVWVGMFGG